MNTYTDLIQKYNVPVPRYTSYPPANHFTDDFSAGDHVRLIVQSNSGQPQHIAFYIHIPFCKKICFYCGCNACTAKNNAIVENYIQALKQEIKMVMHHIDKSRKVSQIHYGGGTPNAIDVKYLKEINDLFSENFSFIDKPEIAIECNPAHLDYAYIDGLVEAGFNRFSLGIQDFDNEVLKTVNRSPSAIEVTELVQYIKEKDKGASVNLDFIYGLPGQTIASFEKTIEKAVAIRPDRLVTFSYAHVPWMKKHQQILEKKGLPESDEKMAMFLRSAKVLKKAGYIAVGLDHYVLPNDELNNALQNNSLHRNFQGYCTRRTTGQVYAFGVSSISQMEQGYAQNTKDIDTYIKNIADGILPVEKGCVIKAEQQVIKDAITELMCNYRVDFNQLAEKHQLSVQKVFGILHFNPTKLDEFIADKLLQLENNTIEVSETGKLFIRNIAAALDPAYQRQVNKYSKSV